MKNMYAWVPWFRELAGRIAEGGERRLLGRAKDMKWPTKDPAILKFGDKNIDPLSFLNYISSSHKAMKLVHEEFVEDSELPQDDRWERVFPMVAARKAFLNDRETFNLGLLWELFRQAQPDEPQIDAGTFDSVLKSPGVGVFNLTSALSLTNAHAFLPLGPQAKDLGKHVPVLDRLGKWKMEAFTLSTYYAIRRQAQGVCPKCHLHEIARFLYVQGTGREGCVSAHSEFFHISTNVFADDQDRWSEFEESNLVYVGGTPPRRQFPLTKPKPGDIMLVRFGKKKGHGIGVVLENEYRKAGGFVKDARIHVLWINKTGTPLPVQTAEDGMGYALPENATFAAFAESPAYEPTFRLLEELGVKTNGRRRPRPPVNSTVPVTHPLNQVLYGPPGTGKTWDTVARAVAIIKGCRTEDVLSDGRGTLKARFDTYRKQRRVEMVTFHQNYAYEDFIEGIRPTVEDTSAEGVGYVLRPGVFREMVERAAQNLRTSQTAEKDAWTSQEVVQGFLEWIRSETASSGAKRLGKGAGGRDILVSGVYESRDGDIAGVQLGGTTNQKLFRRVLDRDYRAFHDGGITEYTEIGRTRPGSSTWHGQAIYFFELLKMMRNYHKDVWRRPERKTTERKNFVLILDEINRGNIARIFGELITLVEESRRIGRADETKVTLPYSGEEFGVPENLYLIGTMNTADRSIALLDTALRRRFEFVEMMPDSSLLDREVAEVHLGSLLDAMNERIRFLRDREHQIGHTYFLEVRGLDGLRKVFQKQILPLLQEYFYDDWAKIAAVLGNNGFVESVKCPVALKGTELVEPGVKSYELLRFDDPKWGESGPYQRIYSERAVDGQGADEAEEKGGGADGE